MERLYSGGHRPIVGAPAAARSTAGRCAGRSARRDRQGMISLLSRGLLMPGGEAMA